MGGNIVNILSSVLIVFAGWVACVIADTYYKFDSRAYYWFVGVSTGILGGLLAGGIL